MTTETRQAKCSYCKKTRESSIDLAFFMDKSEVQDRCAFMVPVQGEPFLGLPDTESRCGYTMLAHERFSGRLRDIVRPGIWPPNVPAHEYVEPTEGEPFDEYYCGCFGWD
jgi:3,4-dihydroxy-2-butanone 4-phosphate synthase